MSFSVRNKTEDKSSSILFMNPTIRGNRDFKTKYIFDGPISSGGGGGEWENEKDDDSKAAHTAHVRSLSSHTSNT